MSARLSALPIKFSMAHAQILSKSLPLQGFVGHTTKTCKHLLILLLTKYLHSLLDQFPVKTFGHV